MIRIVEVSPSGGLKNMARELNEKIGELRVLEQAEFRIASVVFRQPSGGGVPFYVVFLESEPES